MIYPPNTAAAIQFAYGIEPGLGAPCSISSADVTGITVWDEVAIGYPQPTPAEIQAILDSPEFAAWELKQTDPTEQEIATAETELDRRIMRGLARFLYLDLYGAMRKLHPGLPDLTFEQFVTKIKQRIREVSP